METRIDTEKVIADLINATYGVESTARQKHHFRESLRGLVRLSKAELLLEIRTSINKLTGQFGMPATRQKKKNSERCINDKSQYQFEFSQFDLEILNKPLSSKV